MCPGVILAPHPPKHVPTPRTHSGTKKKTSAENSTPDYPRYKPHKSPTPAVVPNRPPTSLPPEKILLRAARRTERETMSERVPNCDSESMDTDSSEGTVSTPRSQTPAPTQHSQAPAPPRTTNISTALALSWLPSGNEPLHNPPLSAR